MKTIVIATSAVFGSVGAAFAGEPVPAPLAGAFGPVGLGLAGAGYVGYLLYKRYRAR